MESSSPSAISVSQFTLHIRQLLETDELLADVWVEGEISNLTQHSSGHIYFSLKDADAQVSCALFKGNAMRYMRNLPKHGEKIMARGRVSVYPPRGGYQLIVSEIQKSGKGDLHQQFLDLKEKLMAEGLFDPARKKPIPQIPKVIGIATSPTGAVIRDILNTLRRKYPHVKVLVILTAVQGPPAAESIVRSLQKLNQLPELDVIILARGGGSLEDLWCFNEEKVARAIAASRIPVISGVGHETDTTIADFVADLRASTPTAAAEAAVPDAEGIEDWLDDAAEQMAKSLTYFIDFRRQVLDDYSHRLETAIQGGIVQSRIELNQIEQRLSSLKDNQFRRVRHELELLQAQLESLNLRRVLERGFTITRANGKAITQADDLSAGESIETIYAFGKSTSTIDEIIADE